jgi:uncharacterized protein (TIGR03083 family)
VTDVGAATELVRTEWTRFVDTLDAAGPDVWDRPTRLAGWTVEDLARHVHWGTTLETDGLRLTATGEAGPAGGTPFDGPRAEIVAALRRAVADLVQRLEEVPEPLGGVMPMPYGEIPTPLALRIFVMEAAIHGSDLADAVPVPGRDGAQLPSGALRSCAAVFQAFWPVLASAAPEEPPTGTTIRIVGPTVALEGTFDGTAWGPVSAEPTVVVEGSDDAVLLYAFGRLPLGKADLTVTGDRHLALRFKEYVPGP